MIALGAIAERGRIGPALVFTFVWSTLVYDPIAVSSISPAPLQSFSDSLASLRLSKLLCDRWV